MKKNTRFPILGIVCLLMTFSVPTWAQTSPILETFTNITSDPGTTSSYLNRSWVGDDAGLWTATDARIDQEITGPAILVRNGELTSPSVAGGIGSLTVTTQRIFGSGDYDAEVFVNGVSVGTVPYGTDAQTTVISDINVAGNVIVAFVNDAGGARVAIDDLSWTAYSSDDPLLSAAPGSLTGFDYDLGEGPSAVQNFDVSGLNLEPSTGNVFINAPTFFEISTDNITFGPSALIPYSGGSLSPTTIYVRLQDELSDGTYNGNISIESGTAPDIFVFVEGTVSIPIEAPDLIISEVADPGDDAGARFVEVYNNGTTTIDFASTTVYLARYANANAEPQTVQLVGSLPPGGFFVIAQNLADFGSAYGTTADLISGIISGNGDDSYVLFVGGDWDQGGELFDVYGEPGTDGSGEAWEYENSRAIRTNLTTSPNEVWTASEWTISEADVADMTPGTGEGTPTGTEYIFDGISWTPTDPNGTATASDNISILSGTAILTQDITINNINIDSDGVLNVEQVLSLNGDITNDGVIVFVSSATVQGQLDIIDLDNSNYSGSGMIVSERYIPARADGKGAYRYLTSPVQSTMSIHADWQQNATGINDNPDPGYGMFITGSDTGANGFDATPSGAPSMFEFDVATQAYTPVPNTDVLSLEQGHPYVVYVWGDRSLDIVNTPEGNDPPATSTTLLSHGNIEPGTFVANSLSEVAGEFSLIGNPYQGILDMNSVIANSTNINPNHYYVWDPNLGTRGAYATVSLPAGSNPQESDADQFLQVGQAVFVSTAANGPASVTFSQDNKSVYEVPTDVFRSTENGTNAFINMKLFTSEAHVSGNTLSDAFQINFSEGESNSVMLNDALKIPNMDENLGIANGDQLLSISNRDIPVDGETIPLFTDQYRTNAYVFEVSLEALPENMHVYLVDNYLDIQTELAPDNTTIVDFSVDATIAASIAPDRFSLFFSENALSTNDSFVGNLTLYPNPVRNNIFHIANLQAGKTSVSVYTILGQQVLNLQNEAPANGKLSVETNNLQPGLYVVEVVQNGSKKTTKVLIE